MSTEPTYDVVIRDATVVDGTGADPRVADVAVADDRIAAVGDVPGRGHQEVDADGLLLTPGFIDVHTHLDAQVFWDPLVTSSCWHGVTTVVLGNCGVTFAPVPEAGPDYLAELMESVEDIPRETILEGLPWGWSTYGQYLEALEATPLGTNVAGLVGHTALRATAMGDRALEPAAHPTAAELATMVDLVDEALDAGALGVSTSRTLRHRAPDGRHVPGTWAQLDELRALAEPLRQRQLGILEVAPRFDGDGPSAPRAHSEIALMEQVASSCGRPLTFNLTHTWEDPEHHLLALSLARAAGARGADLRPQSTSRPIGILLSLEGMSPFGGSPAWQELVTGDHDTRLGAMATHRARLIAEAIHPPAEALERMYVMTPDTGPRYDCLPSSSLAAIAKDRGTTAAEAYVDLQLEHDGQVVISWPMLNQSTDAIAEMLDDPLLLLGLADAGAHVGQIFDASQPTHLLAHWVRDRGRLTIAEAVHRITGDPAAFLGLTDRGTIAPGAMADLNLIDLARLGLELPRFVHDLPRGAGRYVQRADGYRATWVNGKPFMVDGVHAGGHHGRVLRPAGA